MEKLKAALVIAVEKWLKVKVLRGDTWSLLTRLEPSSVKVLRWSRLSQSEFFGVQAFIVENIRNSPSQLQQDLVAQFIFLLSRNITDNRESPFFVEIGANDGVYLSNTYMLQEHFGWRGILSEANENHRNKLETERKGAVIDFRAVTRQSGEEVVFNLAENSEYSSVEGYSIQDNQFQNYTKVLKQSISLTDLLKEYSAPSRIDFLSLDIEGSELEVLQGLDFQKYRFNFVAVEVSRNSRHIAEILKSSGYEQILESVSRWDQWWIDSELFEKLRESEKAGVVKDF